MTSKPAFFRLTAIGKPIVPNPTNPILFPMTILSSSLSPTLFRPSPYPSRPSVSTGGWYRSKRSLPAAGRQHAIVRRMARSSYVYSRSRLSVSLTILKIQKASTRPFRCAEETCAYSPTTPNLDLVSVSGEARNTRWLTPRARAEFHLGLRQRLVNELETSRHSGQRFTVDYW
jgi:hypothetical protein